MKVGADSSARAENNAPLTRGESLKICVPLRRGVFLEIGFFLFWVLAEIYKNVMS